MARAAIAIQDVTASGKNVVFTTVGADGVEFFNERYAFLIVRNPTAGAIVATIHTNKTVNSDLVVPDRAVSVPASGISCIGLFPSDVYNQTTNKVHVDGASLEVAALAFE